LKDWQDHESGKWQPCAAAVRTGPLGVALDRLINRDGSDVDEAVRAVSRRTGLAESAVRRVADGVPRGTTRRQVPVVPAKPSAVEHRWFERLRRDLREQLLARGLTRADAR
jgi:hypothetical protein